MQNRVAWFSLGTNLFLGVLNIALAIIGPFNAVSIFGLVVGLLCLLSACNVYMQIQSDNSSKE